MFFTIVILSVFLYTSLVEKYERKSIQITVRAVDLSSAHIVWWGWFGCSKWRQLWASNTSCNWSNNRWLAGFHVSFQQSVLHITCFNILCFFYCLPDIEIFVWESFFLNIFFSKCNFYFRVKSGKCKECEHIEKELKTVAVE